MRVPKQVIIDADAVLKKYRRRLKATEDALREMVSMSIRMDPDCEEFDPSMMGTLVEFAQKIRTFVNVNADGTYQKEEDDDDD